MALLTDRKFIHFNRKSDFEAQLNANAISDKQIVFLKDAQEIWTHGTYYGSVEQFLDETNKDSTNAVSAAAVYKALADDEKTIAAALNDLNDRIENLDIPSKVSDLTDDLSLATQDYVDDRLDDVLGISAEGVEAFVNMTKDEDTATGILTEIANKVPKTNAVNGAPLSNTESYFYGTSTTAAATAQKEVSIPSITSLKTGQIIVVKPTITSTVANSTIKLNNFTAYPMRYNNAAITISTNSVVWNASFPSIWVFDGTYWVFLGHGFDNNTTYYAMSQGEATTGTATTARIISAKVLHDTIEGHTKLSSSYQPSSLENDDLILDGGDTYETAFGKLEKSINDNEQITAAALTDLDSRINNTTTELATKQDALVSGTNIKTINNESLLGSGNITIQSGDTNTIETVKVNGTALTPDSNKAVNIDISGKQDTLTPKTPISIVQGTGSSTGTTFIKLVGRQGTDISHIVESTDNGGWEHAGNSGIPTVALVASKVDAKYTKPSTGIPKTDLASAVQTSLGKADTAIQGVKVNGTSVTPDSNKIVDITIPEGELSNNYEPSSLDNENLELAAGDTYEEAFSKLHKALLDNEQIIASSLNDLNTRKAEIDDIPTKTSELTNDSGYLTSHQQLKTINNQSIVGEGNITIQGGSGGDTNVIETVKVNGTALTPDANKAVNIDLTGYDKAPLVIEANDTDTEVPSGTYASITAALAAGREVVLNIAMTESDGELVSLDLAIDYSQADDTYIFDAISYSTSYEATIGSTDNLHFVYTSLSEDDHVHGAILRDGTIGYDATIGNGDNIVITDYDGSGQVKKSTISFDGSTTTKALTQKGTWESFLTLNGGTMNANATLSFPDSDQYYSTTIEPGIIRTTDSDDGFSIIIDSTIPGIQINRESGNEYTQYFETGVHIHGTADYYQRFPAKSGTFAMTSDIPAAVTESTVSGWGFTKNTGTVTGVKINGTTKNPTSGVVDLGTVLTSFTETDPTVPAWAKAASKPTYTAAEVGALPDTYTPPVISVNGKTGAVNLTIPSAPGTLNTTATTAQSTSSSEALSGNITLHKVSKTGSYNDLNDKPTIANNYVTGGRVDTSDGTIILSRSGLGELRITGMNQYVNGVADDKVSKTGDTMTGALTVNAAAANTVNIIGGDNTSGNQIALNVGSGSHANMFQVFDDGSAHVVANGTLEVTPTAVGQIGLEITVNAATDTALTTNGKVIANQFVKSGGTSNQLLRADGSVMTFPAFSSADNGKVLGVVNGSLAWVTPTSIYSGTSEPDSNTGNNGDLYLQTS